VSNNESAGDDITVETVDPAEAISLQDSQSTVDVLWDEESQTVIDDSDGLADEQLKENNDVSSVGGIDTAIDVGELQPAQSQHYNLRPIWVRSYSHRLASNMNAATGTKSYDPHVQLLQFASNNMETCPGDMFSYIFGFMMTQMMALQGIRKHGQKAVDALFSEFCQLDDRMVFEPIDASTLTREQKKAALRAINLIKEKRSGVLKGRTCADGSVQRTMYTKEETASPTVSTDALMFPDDRCF